MATTTQTTAEAPQTSPVTTAPDVMTTGRDARITVYLEPELAACIHHVASTLGVTASAWIRDVTFERLLAAGKIPQEMLVNLARRA